MLDKVRGSRVWQSLLGWWSRLFSHATQRGDASGSAEREPEISPSASVLPATLITPDAIDLHNRTPAFSVMTTDITTEIALTLKAEWRITLGSLRQIPLPIVVGHYQYDVISGAEQVLDQSLDGYLTRWQQLGIYAGEIGSSVLVLHEKSIPAGALVIGLGVAGQLTQARLTTSFAQGLIRYTQHPQSIRSPEGVWQLGLLLIGSQAPNMTIRQVLMGLMEGVRLAVQRLQVIGQTVRFSLEIVEIDAWRAGEASDVLWELLQQAPAKTEFVLTKRLQSSVVGAPSLSLPLALQNWWSHWQLTSALLARPVMSSDIRQPVWSLLPASVQAIASHHAVLLLDLDSALVQWELLSAQELDAKPLGLRVGVVRQLVVNAVLMPNTKPLVVWVTESNPILESQPLSLLLSQITYTQEWVDLRNAAAVFCALHTSMATLLHWQGELSGTTKQPYLCLTDNYRLGIADIAQIRVAPRLLVLELTTLPESQSVLVALIQAWLSVGVQAVVVNNQPMSAELRLYWLTVFYQSLLRGEGVGLAAFHARQALFSKTASTEWAIFQCYGDPHCRVTEGLAPE